MRSFLEYKAYLRRTADAKRAHNLDLRVATISVFDVYSPASQPGLDRLNLWPSSYAAYASNERSPKALRSSKKRSQGT